MGVGKAESRGVVSTRHGPLRLCFEHRFSHLVWLLLLCLVLQLSGSCMLSTKNSYSHTDVHL